MSHLPIHFNLPRTVFFICAFTVCTFQLYAQDDMFDLDVESVDQSIEDYNSAKEDIEYKIRERECVSESESILEQFKSELAILNELITTVDFTEIKSKVSTNNYVIIADFKEGDKCLKLMYKRVKYLNGCLEPVILKSIDWTPYSNLLDYEKQGKLCIIPVEPSGYTQV